ncbi:hypothetical protein ACG7TL_003947 [Trametes sanguinea]
MLVSKLVVFDSGLAHLKLPILKPLAFGDPAEEPQRNRGTLSILLERYFEWTAEVQIGKYLKTSPEHTRRERMPPTMIKVT